MTLGKRNVLVTFHPVTVEMDRSVGALDELFASLAALDPSSTCSSRSRTPTREAAHSTSGSRPSSPADQRHHAPARTATLHQPHEPGRRRRRQFVERHL